MSINPITVKACNLASRLKESLARPAGLINVHLDPNTLVPNKVIETANSSISRDPLVNWRGELALARDSWTLLGTLASEDNGHICLSRLTSWAGVSHYCRGQMGQRVGCNDPDGVYGRSNAHGVYRQNPPVRKKSLKDPAARNSYAVSGRHRYGSRAASANCPHD